MTTKPKRTQPPNGGTLDRTPHGALARKKLFVAAYLANGKNGTKAAKTVGFSEKTAYSKANALLKDEWVKGAIAEAENKVLADLGMTAESVLRELAKIVHFDIRKLYNPDGTLKSIHELDDSTAGAISSFEIDEVRADGEAVGFTRKVKAVDKKGALDLAMRHFGLLEKDNKLVISGSVTLTQDDADLC